MTQVYQEDGSAVPATVVKAGPCVIVGVRTTDRDGYEAVRLGLVEPVPVRRINKPIRGYLEKHGLPLLRTQREFAARGEGELKLGDRVLVSMFEPSDKVDITGTSKGRGFAGSIKRHGFSGGRATHGSMFHRAPGSIGQSSFPSRVFKGQKMPGRMGGGRVTVKNLVVVRVDPENNLLVVRGAVPGARGTLISIRLSKSAEAARKK
jgi:large subunit ribosomal protein L3